MTPKKTYILCTEAINGRRGINSLYAEAVSCGRYQKPDNGDELYVAYINKGRTMVKIIHIDATGYDLTTRRLSRGNFAMVFLTGRDYVLTAGQMRRLLFDGTFTRDVYQFPLSKFYLSVSQER